MKIVAGMGALEQFPRLVRAGADEVFCGWLPLEWLERFGNLVPLNRRETLYYNLQIDSMEDMRLLAEMMRDAGVPVNLTFNSVGYRPDQYGWLLDRFAALRALGFDRFIVADLGLMLALRRSGIDCRLHMSGETGLYSAAAMPFFRRFAPARYIFNRKLSPEEMAACVRADGGAREYEAFVLNELCHYSGALCASLHCDELEPICRLPYRLWGFEGDAAAQAREAPAELPTDAPGATGCGLCALPELQRAGITHLKLVGRGAQLALLERDVRLLRRALRMLSEAEDASAYRARLLREIPGGRCGHRCYYLPTDR